MSLTDPTPSPPEPLAWLERLTAITVDLVGFTLLALVILGVMRAVVGVCRVWEGGA